jgi:hypothetical protein
MKFPEPRRKLTHYVYTYATDTELVIEIENETNFMKQIIDNVQIGQYEFSVPVNPLVIYSPERNPSHKAMYVFKFEIQIKDIIIAEETNPYIIFRIPRKSFLGSDPNFIYGPEYWRKIYNP